MKLTLLQTREILEIVWLKELSYARWTATNRQASASWGSNGLTCCPSDTSIAA